MLYALMVVLTPVAMVFTALSNWLKRLLASKNGEPSMTEDDFKSMIETIEDEGALESEESELIQSALVFSDITVYDVLTPRVHIAGIDRPFGKQSDRPLFPACRFMNRIWITSSAS